MNLISLDIETLCNVADCPDPKCSHALEPRRNRIACVGLFIKTQTGQVVREVYRDLGDLGARLQGLKPYALIGHNLINFDLKVLRAKGLTLEPELVEDTQLMAVAAVEKIPESYLEWYEAERKAVNKTLPHGQSHREAGKYSLKTLAPYFLGAPPFWEATGNKDDDEYVLKDCEYTFGIYEVLSQLLAQEGTDAFYRTKLLPWAFMLAKGEERGVCLDFPLMAEKEERAKQDAFEARLQLDELWGDAYEAYLAKEREALWTEYQEKKDRAVARLKFPDLKDQTKARAQYVIKTTKAMQRYEAMYLTACRKLEPLNLDSPTQLTWLLRDYLHYDITNYEGEESTGIEVLERLAAEGHKDVATFIKYREATKLTTAFFPSYREYAIEGRIHANFRLSGTRTGRLSSSSPNLQQVSSGIRDIFVSRPEHTFVIRDYSGIEPVVVAYYSQDPILCNLIIRGGNFHSFNTPAFFPYVDCKEEEVKKLYPRERDLAKTVGLALMYGAGPRRIQTAAMAAGFRWNMRECKEKYENFKELYRGVFEFKEMVLDPQLRAGEVVTNLVGRKYRLTADEVQMKGLNTLVQSSASDLLLLSSLKISRAFEEQGISGQPLLWVHDELITEVSDQDLPRAEPIIEAIMTGYKLTTPYGELPLRVEGATSKRWTK